MNSMLPRHNTLLQRNTLRRHSMAANTALAAVISLHMAPRLLMQHLIKSLHTGRHRPNAPIVIKKAILKPRTFTQKMIAG